MVIKKGKMKFKISKEHPEGSIVANEKDLENLKKKGWTIDLHTPYYANFIGAKSLDIHFSFGSWMDNLEFHIRTMGEYGGYYTPEGYEVKIASQSDLDKVIKIIDDIISIEQRLKQLAP